LRNGQSVHVETRVFDLLLVLVNAHGDVVDKDKLVDRVWNGRPVSDDAVSAAIRDLRRAVGDDGRRQSVVKTIYGRGFQLVGRIQVEDNARQPILVVSPFESDEATHDFARAITLDVTAAITRTRSFAVISHQSALAAFAHPDRQGRATGQLSADYALSGRLYTTGTEATLTLLLSNAQSGEVVWADRVTKSMQNLIRDFANLADEIAASVETEIIFHAADHAKLRPIDSLDAWSAYHRAVRNMMQFQIKDAEAVDALLQHAAKLDRRSSRIRAAQSHLAWQHAFLLSGRDRANARSRAIGLADEALELNEYDPQAHWAAGRARLIAGETEEARRALRRSISLNPSFASAYYSLGWTMSHDGTPAPQAIPLPQKARRLSPFDPIRYAFDLLEADLCFFSGDMENARRLAFDAARDPKAHHQAQAIASWLLHATGAEAEAHSLAAEVRRKRPGYGFSDYCAAVPAKGLKRTKVEKHFRALGY
jgi:DNA-binding winged helix-turn-helix (wHTH) protein